MSKYEKIVFGLFIAMILGIVVLVNIDFTGHKIKFYEDKIVVKVDNIYLEDIEKVELLDDMYIGEKIKGTNTVAYLRGTFQLENDTKGKVYVYHDSKPYIKITTKDKVIIYNDKESNETKETYKKLLDVCNISESIDFNEETIIPSESKYTSNDKAVSLALMIPIFLVFGGMVIYCFKSRKPVHFWAGTTVSSEEISNIKAYNRANGIMWGIFGILIVMFPLGASKFEDKGTILVGIIPILQVVVMIICYKFIYSKYKAK